MRIAVPYEDGAVFQHFGRARQFKLYDAENGQITGERIQDTGGSGHGALAGFLAGCGAEVLICGGIGPGALNHPGHEHHGRCSEGTHGCGGHH